MKNCLRLLTFFQFSMETQLALYGASAATNKLMESHLNLTILGLLPRVQSSYIRGPSHTNRQAMEGKAIKASLPSYCYANQGTLTLILNRGERSL